MARRTTPALLTIASLALAGCAATPLYEYGDYSGSLYSYQRDPSTRQDYIEELQEIVERGTRPGDERPVPPGIYAELGYMMLEAGDAAAAERFFVQEKQVWPESTLFMDRLIAVARGEAPRDFVTAAPADASSAEAATVLASGAGAEPQGEAVAPLPSADPAPASAPQPQEPGAPIPEGGVPASLYTQ